MGNTPSTPSRSSTVKRQRNSSPAKSSSKTRSSKIYYADKVRERCASGKRTFIVLKDENEDTFRKEQNRLSSRPDGYYMTEKSGIRAKRQSMPSLEDRPWSGEYVKQHHSFTPSKSHRHVVDVEYVGHRRRSQIAPFIYQQQPSEIRESRANKIKRATIYQRPNEPFEYWNDHAPLLEDHSKSRYSQPYTASMHEF